MKPRYIPAGTLPGIDSRPQWPKPSGTQPPPTTAQPLLLSLHVLDTPEAHREAQRIAGQLDLTQEGSE